MQTNEILKKIKYNRLKPEERFLVDIFNNCKEYIDDKRYKDIVFYKNGSKVLFSFDKKELIFRCNYDEIWNVLEKKYKLYNYDKLKLLVSKYAEEYLNIDISYSRYTKQKNVYIQVKFFEYDDEQRIPEATKFLDKIISQLEIYVSDKYDMSLFFKKQRYMIFCYNYFDNSLWMSLSLIWVKLFFKYRLEENEIENLVNKKMKKSFGLKVKKHNYFTDSPVKSKYLHLFDPDYDFVCTNCGKCKEDKNAKC